jgi:uncharacterized protein (DUF362 family)
MNRHSLTRRTFLEGTAALGAGVAVSAQLNAAAKPAATVVVAEDRTSVAGGKVVGSAVDAMVARLVKKVTGKESVDAAWRAIVPGSKDRVVIKFNALFSNATTSPEVVNAVVKGLVAAGVAEDRIALFDNNHGDYARLGFRQVPGFPKVKCLGAKEDGGFGPDVKVGPVTTNLAKILTERTDVLINLSRLKHHRIAGLTASLKNHLGSIPKQGARSFHRRMQYLADLNALEPIRSRTRLAIVDGLVGIFDQGPMYQPGFTWEAYSLIGGTDATATDVVAREMLLKHRSSLREYRRQKDIRPAVIYLNRCREIELGVADREAIELVKV